MGAYLAWDVGGTAVKTAFVDEKGGFLSEIWRYPAKSDGSVEELLGHFSGMLKEGLERGRAAGLVPEGVGIGFPGPFDYAHGVPLMRGLNKYEALYGLPLGEGLRDRVPDAPPIRFANDADLYAMGECRFGEGRGFSRVMCICIGTGIGSGFWAEGRLVKSGDQVPENGWIYGTPYRESIADHYLSATGLRRMLRQRPGLSGIPDVKELSEAARAGNRAAQEVFAEFGGMLAEVLPGFLRRFEAEALIVGGDVAKSFDLFDGPLREALSREGIELRVSRIFSENTLLAASLLFEKEV